MLLLKIIAVFSISASIGILYRIPRNLVIYASMVGVVAWLEMCMFISSKFILNLEHNYILDSHSISYKLF